MFRFLQPKLSRLEQTLIEQAERESLKNCRAKTRVCLNNIKNTVQMMTTLVETEKQAH